MVKSTKSLDLLLEVVLVYKVEWQLFLIQLLLVVVSISNRTDGVGNRISFKIAQMLVGSSIAFTLSPWWPSNGVLAILVFGNRCTGSESFLIISFLWRELRMILMWFKKHRHRSKFTCLLCLFGFIFYMERGAIATISTFLEVWNWHLKISNATWRVSLLNRWVKSNTTQFRCLVGCLLLKAYCFDVYLIALILFIAYLLFCGWPITTVVKHFLL